MPASPPASPIADNTSAPAGEAASTRPRRRKAAPNTPSHQATSHTTSSPSTTTVDKKTAKSPSPMQRALRKLGLIQPWDFALHVPMRYEDETRITPLRLAPVGEVVQIEGEVIACDISYRPRRQMVVTVNDGTGTATARFFHFYPSQQQAMAVGRRIILRGEVKHSLMGGATMLHPSFRAATGELPETLTPVYPSSGNLPQAYLRRAVLSGLDRAAKAGLLRETIPAAALADLTQRGITLWPLAQALHYLHHPAPDASIAALQDRSHPAWQRLKAEELLAQQLSQAQARLERAAIHAPTLTARTGGLQEQLLAALPFALTTAQRRVTEEIARDLQRNTPMHRLLQGDVGSGKTVIAALAAAICMDAGWQCVLMAPTEILAEQHFRKLLDWLTPLGVGVAWLTGSQKSKDRTAMLARIASGEAQLVVGTHAVIQDKVQFHRLGLAIIDEQHRFGVAQRLALRQKMLLTDTPPPTVQHMQNTHCIDDTAIQQPPPIHQDRQSIQATQEYREEKYTASAICTNSTMPCEPHLLMMSATPIPRTLAMSYYADLHVSTIDELPPGRTPIVTRLINQERRDEVITRIATQISQGRQIYWVCPLIEESEALDLQNATQTWEYLCEALATTATPTGHTATVGLLHSRLPQADKKNIMDAFVTGQLQVLVSTTVIEVGVDVPNASVMVIEHAERFGLSQLHQLRGRVGRGSAASTCILLYATNDAGRVSDTAKERLRAMLETSDGFEIARRDLHIRGPGELLGARQSGAALLRFADLEQDDALLQWAHHWAGVILQQHPQQAQLHVQRWLGERASFIKA